MREINLFEILQSNEEITKGMLTKDNINALSPDETPILSIAVMGNELKSVKVLLEAGANIDVKDEEGWTPLHSAITHGYYKAAELLIEDMEGEDLTIINKIKNKDKNIIKWNRIFNIINGTKYGKGRK